LISRIKIIIICYIYIIALFLTLKVLYMEDSSTTTKNEINKIKKYVKKINKNKINIALSFLIAIALHDQK